MLLESGGGAQYDFRDLLHFGGTTKANNSFAAGGMGEGADVLAFVLLKNYDFSQVRFSSAEWVLDFVLDGGVPEYSGENKGLFACLRKADREVEGNFVELKTSRREFANEFEDAKNLFYHSGNLDFQNPTLNIPGVGGFKLLSRGLMKDGMLHGNFYYAGQRRHFESEEWNTVECVNLWTHKKFDLKKDRDRGIVTRKEIKKHVLRPIIDAADVRELTRVVYRMEPVWKTPGSVQRLISYQEIMGASILEAIVSRLKKEGVKLKFDDKYLANTFCSSPDAVGALKRQGYVICFQFMEDVGMKSITDKFVELQSHYRTPPTAGEGTRMELLYRAVRFMGKTAKEIWVFDREAEKNIFIGQYDENFVWMAKETLSKPFHSALATYLHELDHKHGSDSSSSFSYALTDTEEITLKEIITVGRPEKYQRLGQRWDLSLMLDKLGSANTK